MKKHNMPNTKFWLKIVVVLFMVASMVLTPITGVFAQEVPPVITPQSASQPNSSVAPDSSGDVEQPKENSGQAIPPSDSDSTGAVSQDDTKNPKDKDTKPEKSLGKDKTVEPVNQNTKTQSATASSALAVPQASQMKFELPAQSQASIDESTGSLSYGYPIELPEGRAGMTPELSLKYDSRSNSELGSIAGLGWELSIPFIKREPITGTQNLYSKAYFSSSLSGNLVATTDTTSSQYTTYRNEVEQGDYQKYVYNSNNTWTVTGKDGRTLTFGETATSRQDKPGDSTKVYKWMLSKITDTHGNQIQYSYIKDNGQIYPSQILYTYHVTAAAAHTVTFSYTNPASYGSTSYGSGFPVTTYKLLDTISVSSTIDAQTSSRTYTFNYSPAQFLNQKLLSSITKTTALASYEYNQSFDDTTSFTYSSKTPGWQQGTHSLQNILTSWDNSIYDDIYHADFDANGYEDVLISHYYDTNNHYNRIAMNNGTNFTEASASWNLPTHDLGPNHAIVDVDGDNLPDLHPRWNNDYPYLSALYRNTGSGFIEDQSGTWVMKNYVPEASCGPNVGDGYSMLINSFLSDVNGDGKNDIIWFGGTGSNRFKVYLNNGNGWSVSNNYTFTAAPGANFTIEPQCGGQNTNNNYQALLDFNGDGLLDYYHQTYGTFLNTGSGYAYNSAYSITTSEMGKSGLADINGDGLVDFIGFSYYNGSNPCAIVYLNNGNGFERVNPTTFPPCTMNTNWDPLNLSFTGNASNLGSLLDINSDGFPDIIGPVNATSYVGKVRAINDGKSSWVATPAGSGNLWNPIIAPSYGKFFDVNSDGIMDFITPSTNWDGGNSYASMVYIGKSNIPNRLTKITTPLGAETVIDYSTAPTNGNETSVSPISVVSKITTQNVASGQPSMVSSYTYSGGAYLADSNTKQKRFVGFHKVTSTESGTDLVPLRITETYFHQGNGSDSSTNEPSDTDLVKVGKSYYSIVRSPNSVTKKETWQKYGTTTLLTEPVIGRTSKFIYPSETVTKNTDGAVSVGNAAINTFDTTLMEQTESRSMGAVTVNNDGSYTDIPGDTRYQFTEYSNNSGSTIVKPKRVDIRTGSASNTTISRTDYYYDSQALGTIGSLGDLTKESSWVSGDGATVADTNYTYDSYGNLATIVNPRNSTTTFAYDSSKSLLTSQTNQLGHVTSYEYMTGLLKKITDPNGRITTITYSSVGLPYRTVVANNGGNQTTKQYFEHATPDAWAMYTEVDLVTTRLDRSWQSFDNLGRPIRKVRKLLDHETNTGKGFYVKEDIDYDALGRVIAKSAPSGTVNTDLDYYSSLSQTVASNLYTNTTYDVFNRPLTVSDNIGTTQYTYSGLQTTITDAKNNQKKLKTDSYGNLVEVKEYNNSNVYTTTYDYDIRNLLTKITDALGNIRNFTYNNAGLIVNSEDLHAVNDNTFGTYAYTYDVNGNVLTETQPNGVVVTKTYDLLDRVLTVDSSSTSGITDFTYTYDACTNGKGHVCTVVGNLPNSVSLNKTYIYGIAGSPTSVTLTTGGNSYTTSYLYTKSDVVSKVTYPNGTVVRTVFGDWGLPTKIYTTLPAGIETLNSTITYHHTEQPATILASNGQTTTYNYDSAKLYRKSSVTTTIVGNTVQSYNYTYDAVGNITSITEPAVTKTYTYDDLNRLTQAVYTPTAGGATTYSYQYDAIGNITQANGQTYTYSGTGKTNPHAVTSVGSYNYTYDDNGNMLTAPNQTFAYNWQNQMQSVVLNGTTTINSSYDESGQRFLYQTPTTTEIAASNGYLLRNGTPEISIGLGSLPLAVISGTNIYSSVSDHLGTPVKQFNSSGIIVEDNTYGPYGTTLTHTGSVDTKDGYTGHQEDTDTGLVYANARYYNPSIARFLSQDDFFWNITPQYLLDPQQMNSYSYSRNNPILYIDPTGNSAATLELLFGVGGGAADLSYLAITNPELALGALLGVGGGLLFPNYGAHENLTPQEQAIINPQTGFIGPVKPNITPSPVPRAAKPNITVSPLGGPTKPNILSSPSYPIIPSPYVTIDQINWYVGPGPNGSVMAPGAANQKRYLEVGQDSGYIDYVTNLFRPTASVGNGSTADYYREYGDEGHRIKLEARIRQGKRLLESGRLTDDEARNVRDLNSDMQNSLKGK